MKNSESVIADIKARSKALSWTLDERMRRLWAAAEAEAMGHGGVMAVFKAVGISHRAIYVGLREIEELECSGPEAGRPRIRRPGVGPPTMVEKYPDILEVVESLVEPGDAGRPDVAAPLDAEESPILTEELSVREYVISHGSVEKLFGTLGYSLQANAKVKEGISGDNPDRDAQFDSINRRTETALEENVPVLSVDTKKKE